MSYLDIAFGATLGGDVQGPYGNNTVFKLLGVALPPLTANGYLHYIPGTGLVLDTPGASGATMLSVDYALTLVNGTNVNVNLSLATGNSATVVGPTGAYTISSIVGTKYAYYWVALIPGEVCTIQNLYSSRATGTGIVTPTGADYPVGSSVGYSTVGFFYKPTWDGGNGAWQMVLG